MTLTYTTHSPEETEGVGTALCETLKDNGATRAFIALCGEMGVGKTAFSRGFGLGLGATNIKSPTYTVVNEHNGSPVPLFHFDMYRIESGDDLWTIGYDDYLDRDGYILCEWSERIVEDIPDTAIYVTIARGISENQRTITIEGAL